MNHDLSSISCRVCIQALLCYVELLGLSRLPPTGGKSYPSTSPTTPSDYTPALITIAYLFCVYFLLFSQVRLGCHV